MSWLTVNNNKWLQKTWYMTQKLKGSYDVAKKNIVLCIWCNVMRLRGSRFKKHIIFHILYIIVAPQRPAFWNTSIFTKLIVLTLRLLSLNVRLSSVMQISPHRDVDMWGGGGVWMSHFRGAWQSLNFYKEYLFGFETLIFATLQILYMHKQLVTLQRQSKTWNRIIWPL